ATYQAVYSDDTSLPTTVQADAAGQLTFTIPALGVIVLRAGSTLAALPAGGEVRALPVEGSAVSGLAAITAQVPQGRWSETSFLVRPVGATTWQWLGTATGPSPRVFHDVSAYAAGSLLEYRAITVGADGAGGVTVLGADSTWASVGTAQGAPAASNTGMVNIPGNHQVALSGGACDIWEPACPETALQWDEELGLYTRTFDNVPGGNYEFKVALDGTWATNYGAFGIRNGANSTYSMGAGTYTVTFFYDPVTHDFFNTLHNPILLPGDFLDELTAGLPSGSPNRCSDWSTTCVQTWMHDPDHDGTYTWATDQLPAGTYDIKALHGWGTWSGKQQYPTSGNASLTVPATGDYVECNYTPRDNWDASSFSCAAVAGTAQTVDNQRAYWVDATTLAWPTALVPSGTDPAALKWQLATDPAGGIGGNGHALTSATPGGPTVYPLTRVATGLTSAQVEALPQLASGYLALKLPDTVTEAVAKQLLKGELVVAQRTAQGKLLKLTGVQTQGVLDALYAGAARGAIGGGQALGASFPGGVATLSLWAPTATAVAVDLWPGTAGTGAAACTVPLAEDPATGIWTVAQSDPAAGACPGSWQDRAYKYQVTVYVPPKALWPGQTLPPAEASLYDTVATNSVTDPYSTALTVDSTHSVLVDLTDPAYLPAEYSNPIPAAIRGVDQTIYELHVRDFSIADQSVPAAERGTYAAFGQADSAGVAQLRQLAQAGITSVHLLPVQDIASIPEMRTDQVAVATPSAASNSADQQAALFQQIGTDAAGNPVLVKNRDGFNWGYDPYHWMTPEGSYATDGHQDGGARSAEFRTMVGALHGLNLRVILDQVYNHTYASGQASDQSVLDKIVPGYYYRLNGTGCVYNSTCCDNFASENAMAEQLMIDAVVNWAKNYHVDGFRFDLMDFHSKDTMLAIRAALDELTVAQDGIDGQSIYLYGEGWNFGEVANNALFTQATAGQLGGTGIGTFSNRQRDAVLGSQSPMTAQGFATGAPYETSSNDAVRYGLAGALRSYQLPLANGLTISGNDYSWNGASVGYADQPDEVITYVDAHDGQTLWDQLAMRLPTATSLDDRVRMNTVALATVTLAQTPSFWHGGT
ncbi:MAG: hypothetical protein LBR19_07920, partial [Bifidobacteriaceae bacterium]|nr:hypothetical protein [Bifidobacteriaceae bacterium]